MNGFDIVVLVVLIAFATVGALRGMVREMVGLATWIAAALVGSFFAGDLERLFTWLSNERALRMVSAFIALFGATWILGMIGGVFLIRFLAPRGALRLPNILAGALIGLVRGALLVTIVFLIAGLSSLPQRSWWREAAIAPYFEDAARYAAGFLPKDVARHIRYG